MKMTIEELRRDMLREIDQKINDELQRAFPHASDESREYLFNECRRVALAALPRESQLFLMETLGPAC